MFRCQIKGVIDSRWVYIYMFRCQIKGVIDSHWVYIYMFRCQIKGVIDSHWVYIYTCLGVRLRALSILTGYIYIYV